MFKLTRRVDKEDVAQQISVYRRLLLVAGGVYLFWWFAIVWILPQAFNPFLSRFAVCAFIFLVWLLSFKSEKVRRHLPFLAFVSVWLITLHYYYLFYENGGDSNWIVGAYITVIAINLCLLSTGRLLSYSIFVLALSIAVAFALPHLEKSVFLPGIVTILIQANMGLHARLSVIKNLFDSNQRFQLLFHSTFDGLIVHDRGLILNVNESMGHISGFSPAELIGKSVFDILDPSERSLVQAKLSLDEVPPYETKGLRKDGRLIDVEVRAKSFLYDNKPAKLVAVQDISDRKKAETERIKALALVENLRVRDEFISIASHELKTPISSLKLQTQIIESDLREGGNEVDSQEKITEAISLFNRQIDRLTELVEAMLDIPRISAGKFTLEVGDVDLVGLAKKTISLMAAQNDNTGAPPMTLEAPAKVIVHGDRRRLEQVLENLLSNAIKYGDHNPITIKILDENSGTSLIVEDHGLGIAPEYLSRIFDRFERAISARNISGLGLGLYITRQIVEAHGGKLSVESELGRGSRFKVWFPH